MAKNVPELTDAEFDKLVQGLGGGAHEVETNWPDPWDFDKDALLQGSVMELETVPFGDGPRRRLSVQTTDGVYSLWESVSLRKLFGAVKPGAVILIKYTGMKDLPGGRSQRQFKVAVKPGRG